MVVSFHCQHRTIVNDGESHHKHLRSLQSLPYKRAMTETSDIAAADWEQLVKNMLRAEMMRRGISYEQLALKLAAIGVEDNVLNLRNKVARGRFTATFFTQCLVAIGVNDLQVPSIREILDTAGDDHGAQKLARKNTEHTR